MTNTNWTINDFWTVFARCKSVRLPHNDTNIAWEGGFEMLRVLITLEYGSNLDEN